MKTKQGKSRPREIESPAEVPSRAETLPSENEPRLKSFVLKIDESGRVDTSSMRDRTREQLKTILQDPAIVAMMGTALPPKEITQIFDPAWAGTLLDGLMIIEQVVASKMAGIPSDIAAKAFKLSDNEKDVASPVLAKIVDKYVEKYKIDFIKEFKEEIVLVVMLGAMTKTKFAYARELQREAKVPRIVQPITSKIDDSDVREVIAT